MFLSLFLFGPALAKFLQNFIRTLSSAFLNTHLQDTFVPYKCLIAGGEPFTLYPILNYEICTDAGPTSEPANTSATSKRIPAQPGLAPHHPADHRPENHGDTESPRGATETDADAATAAQTGRATADGEPTIQAGGVGRRQ